MTASTSRPARTARPSRGDRHADLRRRKPGYGCIAGAGGSGVRQFNGIVGASSTVITAERDRAFAVANAARDHRAGAGRAVDQSFFGGVNGAKTSVDLRGFGAFATANTLILVNGRRLNDIDMARRRSLDHSAQFDRAHRNHPRQQRRGALRRQRGRRRHQHRPEERRRRPAGRDARRGRRRLLQPASGQSVSAALNSGPWSTSFYGNAIKSDGYRENNALDQRNGVGNLNYTTPDLKAFLTVTGDDQKLGLPGGRIVDPSIGVNELVTDRRGAATPFDYGNQQGASATAGFTKTIMERRRPHRRWRRAQEGYAKRVSSARYRLPRHFRASPRPITTRHCRPGRSRRD